MNAHGNRNPDSNFLGVWYVCVVVVSAQPVELVRVFFFQKESTREKLSALPRFAVRLEVESGQVQLSRCLCRPSKTPAPNSEPSTLRCPARCCGGSSASGGGHPPPLPRRWRQRRQTLCRGRGALRQRIPALRRRARGSIEAVSPRLRR